MSYKKPFNEELFKKYDKMAKDAAPKIAKKIKLFRRLMITENIYTEYDADMMALSKSKNDKGQDVLTVEHFIECEVKRAFKGTSYKFDDIRIPVRKLKYEKAHWFMFNSDCTAAFFIHADVIQNAQIVSVVNSESNGESEDFLSIDPADCELISLKIEFIDPDGLF